MGTIILVYVIKFISPVFLYFGDVATGQLKTTYMAHVVLLSARIGLEPYLFYQACR